MNLSENLGPRVKRESLRSIIPNLAFFGVGVFIALLLAARWPLIGKVACVGYGVILSIDILRLSFALVAGLFSRPREKDYVIGFFIQVLETVIFSIYFYLLLTRTFLRAEN